MTTINFSQERLNKMLEAYVNGFEDAQTQPPNKLNRLYMYSNNPTFSMQYKMGWSAASAHLEPLIRAAK